MRKHKRGYWFVRWGGKDHYLGKDRTEARKGYLKSLKEWAAWRTARDSRRLPPLTKFFPVFDLVAKFLDAKQLRGGLDLRRYYAKHLRRWTNQFGDARADAVRALDLQSLQDDMLEAGYAPKTVNHDVMAVRAMFDWASGLDMIPAVSLRAVKTLALPPPPDKSLSLDIVHKMIADAPMPMQAWLAVNYLALARPSEVERVAHKERWCLKCR